MYNPVRKDRVIPSIKTTYILAGKVGEVDDNGVSTAVSLTQYIHTAPMMQQ